MNFSGYPVQGKEIIREAVKIATSFPRPAGRENSIPDRYWLMRFIKRCKDIKCRRSININLASSSVTENQIRQYFRRTEAYLRSNDYFEILFQPDRVWNCDETYFKLAEAPSKVYVLDKNRDGQPMQAKKRTREADKINVTTMIACNAKGEYMSPAIVWPYVRLPTH